MHRFPAGLGAFPFERVAGTFGRVKVGLATLTAVVALAATAPAHASTPQPWCGTTPSPADRLPDVTRSYAVHVVYVHAAGAPDRFAEWAPRIVGDAAAMDAWWRTQDATRALRFDLTTVAACTTPYGALDLSSVGLRQPVGGIDGAFRTIRAQLASGFGFREPEKAYLVYFDGPTGQVGNERICGQGAEGGTFGLPGVAVVYLDSCGASTGDAVRPIVAIHELLHVLGAVDDPAPNACEGGHVCDAADDLMTSSLSGGELETRVLDAGRNDYYSHSGRWRDVQDSFFLERLDAADKTPPQTPSALRVGDDPNGFVRFSWTAAGDDVGPVAYRVYQDDLFLRQITATSLVVDSGAGITGYSVRAVDAVGRLSSAVGVRFRAGAGMVDAAGTLIRDTVRPPGIGRVSIRRTARAVRVSWPAVRDAGGVRGYRIRIGTRTLTVTKPAVTLPVARIGSSVSLAAVDRAGNVGPAVVVPRSRLR